MSCKAKRRRIQYILTLSKRPLSLSFLSGRQYPHHRVPLEWPVIHDPNPYHPTPGFYLAYTKNDYNLKLMTKLLDIKARSSNPDTLTFLFTGEDELMWRIGGEGLGHIKQ